MSLVGNFSSDAFEEVSQRAMFATLFEEKSLACNGIWREDAPGQAQRFINVDQVAGLALCGIGIHPCRRPERGGRTDQCEGHVLKEAHDAKFGK